MVYSPANECERVHSPVVAVPRRCRLSVHALVTLCDYPWQSERDRERRDVSAALQAVITWVRERVRERREVSAALQAVITRAERQT